MKKILFMSVLLLICLPALSNPLVKKKPGDIYIELNGASISKNKYIGYARYSMFEPILKIGYELNLLKKISMEASYSFKSKDKPSEVDLGIKLCCLMPWD